MPNISPAIFRNGDISSRSSRLSDHHSIVSLKQMAPQVEVSFWLGFAQIRLRSKHFRYSPTVSMVKLQLLPPVDHQHAPFSYFQHSPTPGQARLHPPPEQRPTDGI